MRILNQAAPWLSSRWYKLSFHPCLARQHRLDGIETRHTQVVLVSRSIGQRGLHGGESNETLLKLHLFEMRHLISTDGCLVDLLIVGVLRGGMSLVHSGSTLALGPACFGSS